MILDFLEPWDPWLRVCSACGAGAMVVGLVRKVLPKALPDGESPDSVERSKRPKPIRPTGAKKAKPSGWTARDQALIDAERRLVTLKTKDGGTITSNRTPLAWESPPLVPEVVSQLERAYLTHRDNLKSLHLSQDWFTEYARFLRNDSGAFIGRGSDYHYKGAPVFNRGCVEPGELHVHAELKGPPSTPLAQFTDWAVAPAPSPHSPEIVGGQWVCHGEPMLMCVDRPHTFRCAQGAFHGPFFWEDDRGCFSGASA